MTPEQRCEAVDANRTWLEDTMAVLLVLLVLDRFADYHNDSATAPVRETAAQAIAIAAAASTQPVRKQLLEQLISMQTSEVWEVCSVLLANMSAVMASIAVLRLCSGICAYLPPTRHSVTIFALRCCSHLLMVPCCNAMCDSPAAVAGSPWQHDVHQVPHGC